MMYLEYILAYLDYSLVTSSHKFLYFGIYWFL